MVKSLKTFAKGYVKSHAVFIPAFFTGLGLVIANFFVPQMNFLFWLGIALIGATELGALTFGISEVVKSKLDDEKYQSSLEEKRFKNLRKHLGQFIVGPEFRKTTTNYNDTAKVNITNSPDAQTMLLMRQSLRLMQESLVRQQGNF